jgi:hypothetical protein
MVRLRRADGFCIAFAEIAAGPLGAAAECVLGYEESERLVSYTRVRRFGVKPFDPRAVGARSRTPGKQEENGQQ